MVEGRDQHAETGENHSRPDPEIHAATSDATQSAMHPAICKLFSRESVRRHWTHPSCIGQSIYKLPDDWLMESNLHDSPCGARTTCSATMWTSNPAQALRARPSHLTRRSCVPVSSAPPLDTGTRQKGRLSACGPGGYVRRPLERTWNPPTP